MDRHQSFDYLVFEDDVPPQPAPSTRKSWWAGIVTAVLLIGSSVAYTSARDAPYFWVPWGDRDTPTSPSAERRPIILTTVASTESLLAQQNAVLGNKVILTFPAPIKDGTVAEGLLTIADWAQQNPPTTVVVESQGIKCSQTTFAFSTSVLSQKIYCRTVSGSTNAAQNGQIVDVPVTFSYPYSPVCQAESQFVQREMQTSGRCSAWGDPHLTTFDGVAYDFQPDGVFRYFSTRNFEIQVFQEKCPPSKTGQANAPSCYQAIAITYADSVLRLYIKDNKVSLMRGSESLRWFQVYKYGGNTEGYRVFLLTDVTSYVDVTVGTWVENYGYLNIVANLSPFFKDPSIQGLMGNWNGIAGDDSKDVTALAKANRYPMDDNLFVCTTTCSKWTTIPTAVDNAALQIYVELANLRQGFTAVDLKTIDWTTYTPTFRTLPPKAVMLQATTDVTARATELCNKVISGVPLCETYVPNKSFFINNVCIADSVFMGDLGIVDNTKIAYLRECRRELEARLIGAIGDVNALAKLNADRDTLQFGELTLCPSNCNGHGQCLPAACQCDSGYTGYACTIVI